MRILPANFLSTASPARLLSPCTPTPITSTIHFQPHLRSAFNPSLTPSTHISHRAFSQKSINCNTPSSNSPFRLSSFPSPQPSQPAESPFPSDPSSQGAKYRYMPKRQWPPDMSKLSPKHQFRLERKYRRRAALKYARPKWVKATKLVQWATIGFVLIYALLFMQWDERGGSPIEEFRTYIFGSLKGAFSAPPSQASMRRPAEGEGSAKE